MKTSIIFWNDYRQSVATSSSDACGRARYSDATVCFSRSTRPKATAARSTTTLFPNLITIPKWCRASQSSRGEWPLAVIKQDSHCYLSLSKASTLERKLRRMDFEWARLPNLQKKYIQFNFQLMIHNSYDYADANSIVKLVPSRAEAYLSISPGRIQIDLFQWLFSSFVNFASKKIRVHLLHERCVRLAARHSQLPAT